MNTTTIGLDIAKAVFQVHGVDARGQPTLHRRLRRAQLVGVFANLPPCLVGIEACGSAHHWARELSKLGHEVKLMPPQFVRAYVKTNKNDARDAEAICEAVRRLLLPHTGNEVRELPGIVGAEDLDPGMIPVEGAQPVLIPLSESLGKGSTAAGEVSCRSACTETLRVALSAGGPSGETRPASARRAGGTRR